MQNNKDTKAVAVVHNETATGVTSDMLRIRETMDAAGSDALLMVPPPPPPYHTCTQMHTQTHTSHTLERMFIWAASL